MCEGRVASLLVVAALGIALLALTVLAACGSESQAALERYVTAMARLHDQWYEAGLPPREGAKLQALAEDAGAIMPPDNLIQEHERYVQALRVVSQATRTRETLEFSEQGHASRYGELAACVNLQVMTSPSVAYQQACGTEYAAESNLIEGEVDLQSALYKLGCEPYPTSFESYSELKCR